MFKVISFVFLLSVQASALDTDIDHFRIHSRNEVQKHIKNISISYKQWLNLEQTSNTAFYCLGETHSKKYRNFYEELIPNLKPNVLFLESVQAKISQMLTDSLAGLDVKLLNAPINSIINKTFNVNQKLKVYGIEQNQQQKNLEHQEERELGRSNKTISRESFIALNASKNMTHNQTHVALYGSLHCSRNDLKLPFSKSFYRLMQEVHPNIKMKSVYVAFKSDLGDFVKSLMGYQLHEKSFVISDTSKVDFEKINYKQPMIKYLQNYDVIIYVND